MSAFRYQAVRGSGAGVEGIVEAEDRRAALRLLAERGLFPSALEPCQQAPGIPASKGSATVPAPPDATGFRFGSGIRGKEITVFSREIAALLDAAIPIPQALEGIAAEESNPAMKLLVATIAQDVRTGVSFSAALAKHPRQFGSLYSSMIRVGEEAGVLPRVMNDLADLLEHDDEVRGEVVSAVAYPLFVLGFGLVTVSVLLTVVLPKLFSMLEEMLETLPLPTLVLLRASGFVSHYWPGILVALVAGGVAFRWFLKSPGGSLQWDRTKLRIPVLGGLVRAASLARFARTLGILVKSGVSLLPALKIVESTVGNQVVAAQIARVAEETRGGDSLAAPLRKLAIFPRSAVQMIAAGEESGQLADMLGKVAQIEERHLRARTKTLVSLLAPILILLVGGVVGFMVIAILLPIFRLSHGIH
jgi:type II secretory pathway component PulF